MSLIVHRCTTCGHPDIYKKGNECCAGKCVFGDHRPSLGKPEIIPTYDGMGAPITTITEPGTKWMGQPLCDCPDCKALYTSAMAVSRG